MMRKLFSAIIIAQLATIQLVYEKPTENRVKLYAKKVDRKKK